MVSSSDVFRNSTLVEVLDDLCVRFIINLPTEELGSVERVYFQIEEAQWYFEDFVRKHNPYLPTLGLRQFAARIFQHCPILQKWGAKHEDAFAEFMAYKTKVPVRGAVMLNETLDKCVLVKGYKSNSLSFPRGKINKEERDEDCAVREVLEETGFDLSGMVSGSDYIEITMREQNVKLYVVPGIPEDTEFLPRTRNEISSVEWHQLADLPTFRKKKNGAAAPGSSKFYMVTPFIAQLRKWIASKGASWLRERQRPVIIDEFTEAEIPEGDETIDEGMDVQQSPRDEETYNYQMQHESVDDPSQTLRSLLGLPATLSNYDSDTRSGTSQAIKGNVESLRYGSQYPPQPQSYEVNPFEREVESRSLLELLQSGGNTQQKDDPTEASGIGAYQGPVGNGRVATETQSRASLSYEALPLNESPHQHFLRAGQDHSPAVSASYPIVRPSPLLSEQSATLLRTLKSSVPGPVNGKATLLSQQYPVVNSHMGPEFVESPAGQNTGDSNQAKSLLSILRSGMNSTNANSQHSSTQPTPPLSTARLAGSPGSAKSSSMSAYFPQLSGLQNNSVDGNQKASLLATLRSRETARRLSSNRASSPLSSGATMPTIPSQLGSPVNRVSPLLSNFDRRQSVRTEQAQSLLSKFRSSMSADSDGKRSVFGSPEEEAAIPVQAGQALHATAPTPTDQGFLFDYLEKVGREAG